MCTLPRDKVTAGPAARIGPRCESAPSAAAVNGYVPAVPPASRPRWQSALRHTVSANQFRNVRSSGPARERDLARRTTGLTPGTAPIDAAAEASASEHGHRRYCYEHVPPRCRKRAKLPREALRPCGGHRASTRAPDIRRVGGPRDGARLFRRSVRRAARQTPYAQRGASACWRCPAQRAASACGSSPPRLHLREEVAAGIAECRLSLSTWRTHGGGSGAPRRSTSSLCEDDDRKESTPMADTQGWWPRRSSLSMAISG
jgi:hypothetical protein